MGSTETVTADQVKADAQVTELLGLVRELVESGEKRAREGVARRIVATLKEAQEHAPPPSPELPPLNEIAHREHNSMYDIVALLRSAENRIDECGGLSDLQTSAQYAHDTLRLVMLARERVEAMQEAFDPYI